MKVRATALGYYGHKRRRPGEVFLLKPFKRSIPEFDNVTKKKSVKTISVTAEMQFSQDWMERADEAARVVPSRPQKKFGKQFLDVNEQVDLPPARAANEPLSEEESLARDEAYERKLNGSDDEQQDNAEDVL